MPVRKRPAVKRDVDKAPNARGVQTVQLTRGSTGFGMVLQSDCCLSGYAIPDGPAEVQGIPVGSRILKVTGKQCLPRRRS